MKRKKKSTANGLVAEAMRWFKKSVTYEGEPYVIDAEQAAAVVCDGLNTIVVARAGSGKTRTIVAKIVYLIARKGVKPEEIMAFVFNANAAKEINERLGKMRVDGAAVVRDAGKVEDDDAVASGDGGNVVAADNKAKAKSVKIATTFHAFARKIVYEACGGKEKCGKILAGEKEKFMLAIVSGMARERKWAKKIKWFVGVMADGEMEEEDLEKFAKMMTLFVNRAQQKYLGGEVTVGEAARRYLMTGGIGVDGKVGMDGGGTDSGVGMDGGGEDERCGVEDVGRGEKVEISKRERLFVELGVECFKRYHWYLLDAKKKLPGFEEYGTDFNLIVSWASKLIAAERGLVREWLGGKKWILIDEYQDFSQLFLAAVMAVREVTDGVVDRREGASGRGVADGARLFVVGDDWQAINRFAGSEVEYFKGFERYFAEGCRRLEITTNYRCDREVVATARKFMKKAMGEKGEFRAFSRRSGKVVLVDPRETECECAVVDYDRRVEGRDLIYKQMARKMVGRVPKSATVQYVKTVAEVVRKNRKAGEILILHRNNVMEMEGVSLMRLSHGLRWGLERLGVMTTAEYDVRVRVMTMHKSKGLEAEVVIILEADEGVIPKTHPDTRLYGVFGETEEVAMDDQKRLFYVAMTRAKRRLYIMHDFGGGEGFVKYLGRGVER